MIEIYITDDINKINFKILGIFELEMRPGKQLFPLNYNNIINNKDIKYNIKAIKLVVRETYGGKRTYINQIMFFEQSAEEVKDLLCSNDLNKYYKLNKRLLNSNNTEQKKINKRNKNSSNKKYKKNKTFDEKQDESNIYKISDMTNGKENNNKGKNINMEITPMTKKPFRQIKTDIKNSNKNNLKKDNKLELNINNKKNNRKDNLTPNKYLKRINNLNKGHNTSNYSKYNHNIQFGKDFGFNLKDNNSNIKQNLENSLFNSSLNNNSGINSPNEKNNLMMDNNEYEYENMNNLEEEEQEEGIEEQQNVNSIQFGNNNNQYINGNNQRNNYNNKANFENIEDNVSNISENKQRMYRTHQNINYNQRLNPNFPNLNNFKSNNNSSFLTEQNRNEMSINSNNNCTQRYSMITMNENYNNMKNQKINNIKQKLDYLEGNILEIKKNLQEISEGFSFCVSKEFIINNFREQILSICEEIYNEYYTNNNYNKDNDNDNEDEDNNNDNYINEQNGNESLMTNSNYISQNETNNNNQLEKDLENQINQKIDEKLGSLQNNIFDKYLKPTINKIGNSMNKYIDQIQLEVNNINDRQNINNINTASKNELSSKLSTSKIRNQKFDEINKIGERLYNKLKEKEQKLKLLKQEKAKFLIENKDDD